MNAKRALAASAFDWAAAAAAAAALVTVDDLFEYDDLPAIIEKGQSKKK